MSAELSEVVRCQIVLLSDEGLSQRQIAAKLKVSKGAVQRTLQRFSETKSFSSKARSGRPKATTPSEDQYIKLTCLRDRTASASKIQSQLNKERPTPVSKTTVKRRLAKCSLNGRVAVSKPLLQPQNKSKRLAWAKRYRNFTVEDWKKVLFTDESKFELLGCNRRAYVRRRPHERLMQQCIKPTVKHGGGNIQVWGCSAYSGVGDLHRINYTDQREVPLYSTEACHPFWLKVVWKMIHFPAGQ